jgi:hypothetical protein
MTSKPSIPSQAVPLLICETVILCSCYLAGVYWAGPIDYGPSFASQFLWNDNGLLRLLLLIATMVTALYLTDRQQGWQTRSVIGLFQQTCLVVGGAFVVQAFIGYLLTGLIVPRTVMLLGSLMVLIAIPLFRMLYATLRRSGPPPQVDPHPKF